MSTQSAIARLLDFVSRPPHDYRPATDVFLDIDVHRVAGEMRLIERGAERGSRNLPPAGAGIFDEVEQEVGERIESHKRAAHSTFLDQLQTYSQRLAGLDFEGRFAVIRQAAPEAVGEFKAEAGLGRDELYNLKRRLLESEQERDEFRQKHRLRRPARLATPAKQFLKLAVLAILFVLEVGVNGAFLAKGSEQGFLGGGVQAFTFAALNILVSFLVGLVAIRQINRRNLLWKLIGFISTIAYLIFAVCLNLALAHYREISGEMIGDAGQQVLLRIVQQPIALHDINSWLFFAIGLVFSVVAMTDGLLFLDPYPGYGALEKRCVAAQDEYTDTKAGLINGLREIRDRASDAMTTSARDLSVRRGEHDAILLGRSRLGSRFAEYQSHLETAGHSLLAIYRDANVRARTDPAPSHFSQSYKMNRLAADVEDVTPTSRSDLRKKIEEADELLRRQVEAIHQEFDRAVLTYRELDELMPEQIIGAKANKPQ